MQVDAIADEDGLEHEGDGLWPFRSFVEQLILDMFDPGEFFVHVVTYRTFSFVVFFFPSFLAFSSR